MNWLIADELIKSALKEDIPDGDITTEPIIDEYSRSCVDLIAKEDGIIAGLKVFERVFETLGDVKTELFKNDGDKVKKGELIATLKGSTRNLLTGERTALNYLRHMSGIATMTNKYVTALDGTKTRLLDTRKTTPNMRIFEKYAVKVGGACNHRQNLSDGVLIKDNHINAAGGITRAIELVRNNVSFVRKIEVEVENLDMVREALDAKADIIMLDNMDNETMKKAVEIIGGKALIEASGNKTLEGLKAVAETGVNFISTGAITHSFKELDLSMKNLRNI